MRGRLINPQIVELAQLDTDATASAGGYDPIFREPTPAGATGDARVEKAAIYLPCQVEIGEYERTNMRPAGNDPSTRITLVFHFEDLEAEGMIDANGHPTIRLGDRAVSIRRLDDNSVIQKLGLNGAGVYAVEVQPQSFGLSGGERNLLVVTFTDRESTYAGTA